jgi:hypothetical protein
MGKATLSPSGSDQIKNTLLGGAMPTSLRASYDADELAQKLGFVSFSTDFLIRCYRVFDGDIKSAIIFNVISLWALRQREEAEDSQQVAGFSCNNHSISIATGIPYETVRRKVKAMVENGWLEFSDSSHVVLNSDKWQEVLSDVVDPERCVVGYVRSTDVTPSFSRNERRGSPADRRS